MTLTRRFRGLMLLVPVVVVLLGTLPWNGNPMPIRASELRVLMCARNMADGGSWLVPVYDREVRVNKPPLMYWVVASVFRVAGGSDSLAVARGVNAALGVFLVLAVYGCGRYWVGRRRAWVSALTVATSYLFLRFARVCETDIALTLFTLLACFSLWRAGISRSGWRWWVLAGVFAGIGFMFKGPAALVLPVAALATAYVTGAAHSWKRSGAGLLLLMVPFLVIVLPWYLKLMLGQINGAAQQDIGYEVAALMKESPHKRAIIYYLYVLPIAMMPWGLFLPAAMVQAWRRRGRPGVRFLMGWLVSAVVLMSLLKSKQLHYAMLLMPPAALLTGGYLCEAARNPLRFKGVGSFLHGISWLMVVAGGGVVLLPWFVEGVSCRVGFWWGLPVILTGVVAALVKRGNPVSRGMIALMVMSVWTAAGFSAVFHELREPAAIYRECAAEVRNRAGVATQVFITGRRVIPMEYYVHKPIQESDDFAQAWDSALPGDLVIVSVNSKHRHVLTMAPPCPPVFERRQGDVELKIYVR